MPFVYKTALSVMSGKSASTVDRAIRDGEIHVERIGGRVLIPLDEAKRWAASQVAPLATTAEILAVCRP